MSPCSAKIVPSFFSAKQVREAPKNNAIRRVPGALPRVPEEKGRHSAAPTEAVVISLSNLVRLGCLRPEMTWGGGENFGRVNPTIAGQAFVKACRVHGS